MLVEEICFCDELVAEVRVLNGEVQSTEVPQDRPNAAAPTARTVEDLFAQVERGLEFDRMSVRYDEDTGVPLLIVLDPETNTSDDELTIQVADFRIG